MKVEQRFPAAIKFIRENKMNEFFEGDCDDVGIICQAVSIIPSFADCSSSASPIPTTVSQFTA